MHDAFNGISNWLEYDPKTFLLVLSLPPLALFLSVGRMAIQWPRDFGFRAPRAWGLNRLNGYARWRRCFFAAYASIIISKRNAYTRVPE